MIDVLRRAALCAAAAMLAACANTPRPPASPEPVLVPNANLLAQGIPEIPQSLVDRVARYIDFRGHFFVDWHPQARRMLVAHRKAGDNLVQLYLLDGPLAEPQQLTSDAEPVWDGSFEPRDGRYVVFSRSRGGDEASQLFRLDLDGRQTTQLTPPDEQHTAVAWQRGSGRLLVASLPLDRTASGGTRAEIATRLWLTDPMRPGSRQDVATLPGGGWYGSDISPDDRTLAMVHYVSATESEIWLLDLASGQRRRLLPRAGETGRSSNQSAGFTPDGRGLWLTSSRDGEFTQAYRADVGSGALQPFSRQIPWDIDGLSASADGRLVAMRANVEGRVELRLFDAVGGAEVRPAAALPGGAVNAASFHRRLGVVAFAVDGATGPGQVFTLDTQSGRVEQWTRAYAPPGVAMERFADQEIIRWKSFDGLGLSGLISRPPSSFAGRRPVLIEIHGGPEGQAQVGFLGRYNFFVQELGIALIQPNVRGSSGFGKSFLDLDNGMKREDSVRDIGALLDWIAAQPDLDVSRVMVTGGSYGGYMSLACAVHFSDRLVGAIDDVGISHFVTFLNNTESYRRDLRRVEYGDERDPAMREFLDRISPLTQASRIGRPLFVVQGRNDPRVPYTEAEQIVQRVRASGVPVWYLRAENEGHGFVRKENADFRFYAMVRFVERFLLGERKEPMR